MSEILEVAIKLKKLVRNIERTLDQTQYIKEWIRLILDCPVHYSSTVTHCIIFTFFYLHKKKVLDSRKILDIRFSMDLHVSKCPQHDLTMFRKCLSVGRSVWMSPKFCEHCISRCNERKLMKLHIQLHLDVIWC